MDFNIDKNKRLYLAKKLNLLPPLIDIIINVNVSKIDEQLIYRVTGIKRITHKKYDNNGKIINNKIYANIKIHGISSYHEFTIIGKDYISPAYYTDCISWVDRKLMTISVLNLSVDNANIVPNVRNIKYS